MKIALDQSTDYSNKELYHFLSDAYTPNYVKQAELDDSATLAGLKKEAFADESRRAFPLNTKARCFVSNAFFMNKEASIKERFGKKYAAKIKASIKEAAELHDIEQDLEEYNISLNVKEAAATADRYLLNEQIGDRMVALFPVKTAADLGNAADTFEKDLSKLPYEWRFKTAAEFVKVAKELCVEELPDIICKYAGMFYADAQHLSDELWRRSQRLKKEANQKIYEQLREGVLEHAGDYQSVQKIADICFRIEDMEGLYDIPKVASVLGDPVDSLFNLPIEKVADLLNVVKLGDEVYSLEELSKVSSDKYKEAFGLDIDPTKTAELRDVLPTMPRSDVALFRELTGITPL